jgi:hypothetical protein
MRRVLLAVMVTMSWPMMSAAQSRAERPVALPVMPPIGLPLAPIGLPLPAIGLPPATPATVGPHGSAPHDGGRGTLHGDRRHDGRTRVPFVYVVPAYDWPLMAVAQPAADTGVSSPPPASATPPSTSGRLRLDIDAADPVQVFVDGYYAGTLSELNNELDIEPGPHRVEMRAAGYEPLSVDVRLPAGRSISYRAALTPSAASVTPETAAPRTTIYFIPGCYLGNVHPSEVSLPAGCDLSQLVIRKP